MSILAIGGFFATNASAALFNKHGNNGTAPCSAFCAGPQWHGGVGDCVSAKITPGGASISCDTAVGLLDPGFELTCECRFRPGEFLKHGDNGTAPCAYFCEHIEFPGGNGSCVTSWRTDTREEVPCGLGTGFLPGNELTCQCRADR
jgi:hypothetical protein